MKEPLTLLTAGEGGKVGSGFKNRRCQKETHLKHCMDAITKPVSVLRDI
jgi:hypothetical protein